ncbi:MAG: hypothetical protein MK135_09580, partial [Polyangiaceae bacterium]|nr:hypothetical protein [Polyangiaceae bacterium]
ELGVTETRDRSGILLFLSELEGRVVLLADKGIHDRVEEDEWSQDVDRLVDAIKKGKPGAGTIECVQRLGSLLASSFPPREDDENELADGVRQI